MAAELVRAEEIHYSRAHNDALRYALYSLWKQRCHHCDLWLTSAKRTAIDHVISKDLKNQPAARAAALAFVGLTEPFDLDSVENLAPIHPECNGADGKGTTKKLTGYLLERSEKARRRAPKVRELAAKILNSHGLQQAIAAVDSYENFKERGDLDGYEGAARVMLQAFQDVVPNLFDEVVVEKSDFNFSLEEVMSENDIPTEVGVGLGLTASDQAILKLIHSVCGITTEELMEKVLRSSMDAARSPAEEAAALYVDRYSNPGGAIFSRYDIAIDKISHSGDCSDPVELRISAEGTAGIDVVHGPTARSVYKEVEIRTPMEVRVSFPSMIGNDVEIETFITVGCETAVDGPLPDWDDYFVMASEESDG